MTLRVRALPVLALLGVAGVIAAADGLSTAAASPWHSARAAAATPVVALKNIQFHPSTVHIKVGQSVTWKWEDADIETAHNVTSIGHTKFKSSTTKQAGTYHRGEWGQGVQVSSFRKDRKEAIQRYEHARDILIGLVKIGGGTFSLGGLNTRT